MRSILRFMRRGRLGAVLAVLFLSRGEMRAAEPVRAHSPATLHSPPSATPREDAASSPALEKTVNELLRELDAPLRSRREAAMQKLRALGPEVLPVIPPPELLPSAAVQEAMGKIRVELERQLAEKSILPSRVTLSGQRSHAAWLVELHRQTGNRLGTERIPAAVLQQPLRVELSAVPYWDAVETLLRSAKARVSDERERRQLALEPNGPRAAGAATSSGAFRISSDGGTLRKAFVKSEGRLLRVSLDVFAEPRLRPLFLHYAGSEIIAATATGEELPPLSPEAKFEIALGEGGSHAALHLDFLTHSAQPSGPIDLRGRFWMTTAAAQEPIRFKNLQELQARPGRGVARRRGGVTVTVKRVEWSALPPVVEPGKSSAGAELRVEVQVHYDVGGPAFESHRTWILHNAVFLETAGGEKIPLNGGSTTRQQADGAIVLEYRFLNVPRALAEYAFVYITPTLILDVPVDFRLNSVPVRP